MPFSQFKEIKTFCEERSCIAAVNFLKFINKSTSLCCNINCNLCLTLECIMSQNGQTHFKNLTANADHFGTLCRKELKVNNKETKNHELILSILKF